VPTGDRTSQRVLDAVAQLHRAGRTPTQIEKKIYDRAMGNCGEEQRLHHALSLSSIKRIVSNLKRAEKPGGEPWTLIDDDTNEPAIVLETLAEVIADNEGRVVSLTADEARMVARIGRAFPDLPAIARWEIAVLYLARRATDRRTDDIDGYLAFAPWRFWPNDDVQIRRSQIYDRAQRLGWIPVQPDTSGASHVRSDPQHAARTAEYASASQKIRQGWAASGFQPILDDSEENTVSNPVSNDARFVTERRRSQRPSALGPQDMANAGE